MIGGFVRRALATRLIGREWAIERLRQLFARDEVRLVTLIGPGGSGKTRLALHVASELLDAFPHGVWLVTLDGVNNPGLVPMSIMQALYITPSPDLTPVQSLCNYLRDKRLLLVLDNFEQVKDAASVVDEILAVAPGLKVMITSRVVLHLYGERQFSVPPLDIPGPTVMLDPLALSQFEAVQLFVERAQVVLPGFALTTENAACIAQICTRLDGLPLALELAAARIKLLPPALLLERLSGAMLSVLTGGARNLPTRQHTLRSTLKWSYDLLDSGEQRLFRWLSIFVGRWTLEAVEAVCSSHATSTTPTTLTTLEVVEAVCAAREDASLSVLNGLTSLLDKSLLLQVEQQGVEPHLDMLMVVREYALERLRESGEVEVAKYAHARYYLKLAQEAEEQLKGAQQLPWLERMEQEQENVRAALRWLIEQQETEQALNLCGPLWLFWSIRGYWSEGRAG